MHYYLGADETKPTVPFYRVINPTEVEKVAMEIARLIKSYYAGWDFFNIDLWRKLGFDPQAGNGPVVQFLQDYIQISRESRKHLTEENKQWWIDAVVSRSKIRADDAADYIRAMLDMIRAGTMPEIILHPYDYVPTEIGDDIASVSGKVFPKVLLAAAVITGIVILSNSIIPQTAKAIKTMKRK